MGRDVRDVRYPREGEAAAVWVDARDSGFLWAWLNLSQPFTVAASQHEAFVLRTRRYDEINVGSIVRFYRWCKREEYDDIATAARSSQAHQN
jgi:hypothetical protein